MTKRIRTPKPGQQLSAKELARMARIVERNDKRQSATAIYDGVEVWSNAGGEGFRNNAYVWFWAKITAKDTSVPPKYSFLEQHDATTDGVTEDDGASQRNADNSDSTSYPAYELNGRDTPVGELVFMWLAPNGEHYLFWYPGRVQTSTTATISADQNNYTLWTGQILFANITGSYNLTGITGGVNGLWIEMKNVGTGTLTIRNEHSSSTAANRIATPYGIDINVPPKGIVALKYETTSNRWAPMFQYCCGGQIVVGARTFQIAATVTWSSSQDNYTYPDSTYLQANVTGSYDLTGIVGASDSSGARIDGQTVEIANVGSGTLTVKNETTSTALNQIKTADGTDMSVPPRAFIQLKYNLSAQRWYPVHQSPGVTGGGTTGTTISVVDYPLGSTYTGINTLRIDSLQGLQATTAGQPAGTALILGSADIGCKLTAAGPQTIGSGADAKLTFDSAVWDTNSFFSGGSPTKISFAGAFNGVYLVIYRTSLTVSFGSVNTNQVPATDVRLSGAGSGIIGSVDQETLFNLHYRSDGGTTTTDFEHGGCILGRAFMVRISSYTTDYIEVNANPGAANGGDFASTTFSVQKLNASGVLSNLF